MCSLGVLSQTPEKKRGVFKILAWYEPPKLIHAFFLNIQLKVLGHPIKGSCGEYKSGRTTQVKRS